MDIFDALVLYLIGSGFGFIASLFVTYRYSKAVGKGSNSEAAIVIIMFTALWPLVPFWVAALPFVAWMMNRNIK
jgi:hypothetical protein